MGFLAMRAVKNSLQASGVLALLIKVGKNTASLAYWADSAVKSAFTKPSCQAVTYVEISEGEFWA